MADIVNGAGASSSPRRDKKPPAIWAEAEENAESLNPHQTARQLSGACATKGGRIASRSRSEASRDISAESKTARRTGGGQARW